MIKDGQNMCYDFFTILPAFTTKNIWLIFVKFGKFCVIFPPVQAEKYINNTFSCHFPAIFCHFF